MSGIRQGFSLRNFFNTLTTKKSISIIVVLGILVFFNSLPNNFVGDDIPQIVDNKPVHSVKNILTFFTGSTFYSGGAEKPIGIYFRPLPITVFSFLYTIFGPSPFWFHLFDIAIHIFSTVLLFLFLKHFFKRPLAFILSLIFLVHPINSEAVFSISSTQDVLFLFFGILGLWLLVNFKSNKYLALVGVCIFLSLLSKETGLLFALISVAYAVIFERKRLAWLLVALILPIISYLVLKGYAVGFASEASSAPIGQLDSWQRLLNIPEIIFFYIKTFILPVNLSMSYQWAYTKVSGAHFFFPLIIVLALLGLMLWFGLRLHKRFPGVRLKMYIFFGLWLLAGLALHLQLIPLDATVADRWFYFPIIGLLGLIGVILETLRFNWKHNWSLVTVVILLLLLSTRTFVRSFDWRDELGLYLHDAKVSNSYALESGIGFNLTKQGRLQEAKAHIEKSIELYPYVTNYINLGYIYYLSGDYQMAKEANLKALQFFDYYIAYENLAGLALIYGNADENISFLTSALKKFPQNARLWYSLAILEYNNDNIQNAKDAINKAYYYSQDADIVFVYNKIMSDKELKSKIKVIPE